MVNFIPKSLILLKIYVGFFVLPLFYMVISCHAMERQYTIVPKSDGGYLIDLVSEKRIWVPITAEGIFPKKTSRYQLELTGKGSDWAYRNQAGYYYSYEQIASKQKDWDFGYAWIDADRRYIYLNLYQVKSPDEMIPSDINGKYTIRK